MKNKLAILLSLFLILSAAAAEDLTVDYIDGYLDLMEGGSWVEVMPGDVVSSGDTVRLDKDSFVELRGRNKTLSLTQPGVYEITKLLSAQAQTASLGLGSVVSGKLSIMLNDSQVQTQSAVGGVRAAEVQSAPAVDWMESEALEMIEEGKQFLNSGNLSQAISRFEEAYDLAMDDQEEILATYNLGYAYALEGKSGKALEYLTMNNPDPYLENYHNHILLAGNLYLNSFAYDKAVAWFSRYNPSRAAFKAPETEQTIYLLAGAAYKMQGNAGQARVMLQKSVDVDPRSETAGKARDLMAGL